MRKESEKMERFWELDFLRGVAIIAMIVFHFLFDLNLFSEYSFNLHSDVWFFVGRFAALSFVFLVGLCLTISYSRAKEKIHGVKLPFKYIKRGAKTFVLGMLITAFTFVFFPDAIIWFGALHFIGLSVILAYPFLRFRSFNLLFGAAVAIAGLYLLQFRFDFTWLFWLGFFPKGFYTFDYFPLLPWFSMLLFGIFTGNTLYSGAKRRFFIEDCSRFLPVKVLSFLGKNSLLIYFLHQPLLVGLIYLLA